MRVTNPTARDLRRINRQTLFQYLYSKGSLSRLELSQLSGLSAGTVANIVGELLAEDLVVEAGFEASEGGRPRAILALNTDYGYFLGGEIGETEMVVELFDLMLEKLRALRCPLTLEEHTPESVAQIFASKVAQLLNEAGIVTEKVLGLGIGVPGVVEMAEHEMVSTPTWHWQDVPLQTMLKKRLNMRIYVDNGSKVMALAEMYREPERRNETITALNLGTGVGAGIIYEGQLYRGGTNSAGEWGHTTMVLDGAVCRCGRRGCLEAYIGAPGIIRRLREVAPTSPLLASTNELQTISFLVQAAQRKEGVAQQVLRDTLRYLGAGIANLINLFNPQRLILGGSVGLLIGDAFLSELIFEVKRYALRQPFRAMRLQVSQLGGDAVSLGAARLALEAFLAYVGKPQERVSDLKQIGLPRVVVRK